MAELNDCWDSLVKEIEPMIHIGGGLIKEISPLIGKYHVDSDLCWEEMPEGFRNELLSCIASHIDGVAAMPFLGELLGSENLFQLVFEQLEVQHNRLDRGNTSARSLLQHLMLEVMDRSIANGTMGIDDWQSIIEKRKESAKVKDVAEYVYKKYCSRLKPQKEICVYDFFYNKTTPDQIDKMLCNVKDSLILAFSHRELTKKRGQGMSRFVVNYIHQWQNEGLMKPLKSIYPFCQCLEEYWNHEVNLGTRQGLEATYKQKW